MDRFLKAALDEAKKGYEEGGLPIGSVLVYKGKIIGRGHNRRLQNNSAILHAEMDAIENAGRQKAVVYENCTLYTTNKECYGLLQKFIKKNPDIWNEDIGQT